MFVVDAPASGASDHDWLAFHVPVSGSHQSPVLSSRTAISTAATLLLSVAVPLIVNGASIQAP